MPYLRFMNMRHDKTPGSFQDAGAKALRANFRKIDRREWWLWVAAAIITLLLTIALASFLLPNPSSRQDFHTLCSSASRAWSRGPRFLVRSLHHLSASANSQDSPAIDRTGRTLSFDQRECGGHDCSCRFGRPQDFQQSFVSENPWVFA